MSAAWVRPFSVTVGLTVMLAATLTHQPTPAAASAGALDPYVEQELTWRECLPGRGFPFFECSVIVAPLDWADPAKGEIQVAVSRIRATDPSRRRGIVLTNPGGPGEPGVLVPLRGYLAEPDVVAVYDAIGMDVRGVGASTRLRCLDPAAFAASFTIDPRDHSPRNLEALAEFDRLFRRCLLTRPTGAVHHNPAGRARHGSRAVHSR